LKQVRQLARKQFMLRALMQKCRQKAGLHWDFKQFLFVYFAESEVMFL
jgi:hypothetical protein